MCDQLCTLFLQGDLSRKEWVAPALSPLTEGAGTGTTGTTAGIKEKLHSAVEATKEYLPAQVAPPGSFCSGRVS